MKKMAQAHPFQNTSSMWGKKGVNEDWKTHELCRWFDANYRKPDLV